VIYKEGNGGSQSQLYFRYIMQHVLALTKSQHRALWKYKIIGIQHDQIQVTEILTLKCYHVVCSGLHVSIFVMPDNGS
jgi:hypothetical protein